MGLRVLKSPIVQFDNGQAGIHPEALKYSEKRSFCLFFHPGDVAPSKIYVCNIDVKDDLSYSTSHRNPIVHTSLLILHVKPKIVNIPQFSCAYPYEVDYFKRKNVLVWMSLISKHQLHANLSKPHSLLKSYKRPIRLNWNLFRTLCRRVASSSGMPLLFTLLFFVSLCTPVPYYQHYLRIRSPQINPSETNHPTLFIAPFPSVRTQPS